ncbi:hypothetical protein FQZ97_1182410 [compost metagenome]
MEVFITSSSVIVHPVMTALAINMLYFVWGMMTISNWVDQRGDSWYAILTDETRKIHKGSYGYPTKK